MDVSKRHTCSMCSYTAEGLRPVLAVKEMAGTGSHTPWQQVAFFKSSSLTPCTRSSTSTSIFLHACRLPQKESARGSLEFTYAMLPAGNEALTSIISTSLTSGVAIPMSLGVATARALNRKCTI